MKRSIQVKINKLQSFIKEKIQDLTGFYIYKRTELEIGTCLRNDIVRFLGNNVAIVLDVGANIGQSTKQYNQWFANSRAPRKFGVCSEKA